MTSLTMRCVFVLPSVLLLHRKPTILRSSSIERPALLRNSPKLLTSSSVSIVCLARLGDGRSRAPGWDVQQSFGLVKVEYCDRRSSRRVVLLTGWTVEKTYSFHRPEHSSRRLMPLVLPLGLWKLVCQRHAGRRQSGSETQRRC